MGLHALWDFASLAHGLAPATAGTGPSAFLFLCGTYVLSLVLVVLVLRHGGGLNRPGA